MSYDLDTRKRFLDLRARGRSFDRIAKELHVSKRTLITWSVEMQTELDILSALHLDALREELCAKKQQRMELLARQIQRLRQELEGRDLARIHETNLCHLLLRYMVALRKEDDSLDMSFTIPTDEVDMYLDQADFRVDTDPAPPAPEPVSEPAAPAPTPDLSPAPAPLDLDPKPKVQSPMPVFSVPATPAVSDSSPPTPPDAANPSIPAPSSVPPASPGPAPKPKAQGVLLRPCSQRHCEERSDEAIPSERPQAMERDCFAALAMTPSLRISTEQVQGPTSVFAESSVNSVVGTVNILPSGTKTAPKLRQIRLGSLPHPKQIPTLASPAHRPRHLLRRPPTLRLHYINAAGSAMVKARLRAIEAFVTTPVL